VIHGVNAEKKTESDSSALTDLPGDEVSELPTATATKDSVIMSTVAATP